jgi:hypothetical protein
VACGGTNGIIKIFDTTSKTKTNPPIFTLDPHNINVSTKHETNKNSSVAGLNVSQINCMVVYGELIIYGDNGYNIKILDYKKGNRNQLL